MEAEQPIIGYRNRHEGMSFVRASLTPEDDGFCWHPVMFKGVFDHPQAGQIVIGDRNLDGYLLAFSQGLPGPGGIPIDERGDHSVDPDGAFGWIEQLKRAGDTLLGGIRWSSRGIKALQDGIFKYVSPMFSLDNTRNTFGNPNVIISAALTNRPLFYQQDAIQYAAATVLSREALHQMRSQRAQHFGIEVRPDGRLTAAAQYRDEAPRPVDYADPVNFKYPLMPEIRRLQSLDYFAQSFPHYKEERSRRVVYTRIVRSLRLAGHKPPPNPTLDELLPPDLRVWVAQA